MKRVFTHFNIVFVIIAFVVGALLYRYEEKNGILNVAKPEKETFSYETVKNTDENGKININTASEEELKELDGIGDTLAKKIVEYRNVKGKFNRIEDLMKIPGVGTDCFNSIKNDICVWKYKE